MRALRTVALLAMTALPLAAQERVEDAIARLEEKLATLSGTDAEPRERLAALRELAVVYVEVPRYDESARVLREGLEIAAEHMGKESREWVNTASLLLESLSSKGDYAQALGLGTEVLAVARRAFPDDALLSAEIEVRIADIRLARGETARAEELLRGALAGLPAEAHERCSALHLLAMAVDLQGRTEESEGIAREAVAAAERTLEVDDVASLNARNTLAVILSKLGRLDEALAVRKEMDEIYGASENRLALHVLPAHKEGTAMLLVKHGRVADATAIFEDVVRMWRGRVGPLHPEVGRTLMMLGRCRMILGQLDDAERTLLESARIYEVNRLRVGDGMARASFEETPHNLLAWISSSPAARWRAWELKSARVLFELLAGSASALLTPAEEARRARLFDEVLARESDHAATFAVGSQPDVTRAALISAQEGLASFQEELAAKHPLTEGGAYSLDVVQARLAADEAIVGWQLDPARRPDTVNSAFVLRKKGPPRWVSLPRSNRSPGERCEDFQGELARAARRVFGRPDADAADELARDLYAVLVAPLAPALEGVERLIVAPSQGVEAIPLEALLDGSGRRLDERFTVSYVPSATVLAWLRGRAERTARDTKRVLLVGDPPFREEHAEAMRREQSDAAARPRLRSAWPDPDVRAARLPRLPASRDEVAAIAPCFDDALLLLGPAASEERLAELAREGALAGFDAIHVATHARPDLLRPGRSALFLSQVQRGRDIDGLLSVDEVLRTWRLDAELVTLSACQTAFAQTTQGGDRFGFAQAFLMVGARSVIVSLWQVDDVATGLLMKRFYALWRGLDGDPLGKADALRQAKHQLRTWEDESGARPYAHPAYWGAFVLVGDPD